MQSWPDLEPGTASALVANSPSDFAAAAALLLLCAAHRWKQALRLLEVMWQCGGELAPDIVSYNTVMKACGNAQQTDTAFQVCCLDAVPCSVRKTALNYAVIHFECVVLHFTGARSRITYGSSSHINDYVCGVALQTTSCDTCITLSRGQP
jgi:pentatricopeptide repeat protein